MADVFNSKKRSQVMAAIKSKGNKDTEMTLRGIFRKYGISGWRRNQLLEGKPDFVFWNERIVVFVDGCFWHCCPKHGRKPDTNKAYWHAKFARNKVRDRHVSRALRRNGWQVLRIWEHELLKPEQVALRVRRSLQNAPTRNSSIKVEE